MPRDVSVEETIDVEHVNASPGEIGRQGVSRFRSCLDFQVLVSTSCR